MSNILLEDFIKFVPEFMIHQHCESCASRWNQSHPRYKHVDNAEKLIENLRDLFVQFLFRDPMFTDKAKKAAAMNYANKILSLLNDDVLQILLQKSKGKEDISNEIKVAVGIRISAYMRLI